MLRANEASVLDHLEAILDATPTTLVRKDGAFDRKGK